jgi:hypothetical protein
MALNELQIWKDDERKYRSLMSCTIPAFAGGTEDGQVISQYSDQDSKCVPLEFKRANALGLEESD